MTNTCEDNEHQVGGARAEQQRETLRKAHTEGNTNKKTRNEKIITQNKKVSHITDQNPNI